MTARTRPAARSPYSGYQRCSREHLGVRRTRAAVHHRVELHRLAREFGLRLPHTYGIAAYNIAKIAREQHCRAKYSPPRLPSTSRSPGTRRTCEIASRVSTVGWMALRALPSTPRSPSTISSHSGPPSPIVTRDDAPVVVELAQDRAHDRGERTAGGRRSRPCGARRRSARKTRSGCSASRRSRRRTSRVAAARPRGAPPSWRDPSTTPSLRFRLVNT